MLQGTTGELSVYLETLNPAILKRVQDKLATQGHKKIFFLPTRNSGSYNNKKEKLDVRYDDIRISVYIGRLRRNGGQKIDLISLLLNKFS